MGVFSAFLTFSTASNALFFDAAENKAVAYLPSVPKTATGGLIRLKFEEVREREQEGIKRRQEEPRTRNLEKGTKRKNHTSIVLSLRLFVPLKCLRIIVLPFSLCQCGHDWIKREGDTKNTRCHKFSCLSIPITIYHQLYINQLNSWPRSLPFPVKCTKAVWCKHPTADGKSASQWPPSGLAGKERGHEITKQVQVHAHITTYQTRAEVYFIP